MSIGVIVSQRFLRRQSRLYAVYSAMANAGADSRSLQVRGVNSSASSTRKIHQGTLNSGIEHVYNKPTICRQNYRQGDFWQRNKCYHHSQRCSNILASTPDNVVSDPEYLTLVTQTAEKMRHSVRKYIAEYSGNVHVNETHEKHRISSSTLSQDTSCNNTPPPIKLVGILATTSRHQGCHEENSGIDRHGNETYSEQISAICAADGILYEPWRVPPTQVALERAIHHANERLDVHGILVFYPVFDKLIDEEYRSVGNNGRQTSTRGPMKCEVTGVYYKSMDDYFRDLVLPEKDVEGYHRKSLRVRNPECRNEDEQLILECASPMNSTHTGHAKEDNYGPIYPCTALAVFRILESFLTTNSPTDGSAHRLSKCSAFANMTMTIINRSEVFGLPLATMLSNQGATIYSVDKNSILQFQPDGKIRRQHSTVTIKQCTRRSSVIVSGVPSEDFTIPTDWIPDHAIVINVANVCNFDEGTLLTEKEGITYVPHVGRVTVAALESNLICLHRNYHSSLRHKTRNNHET
eukprot:CCRYP_007424-RA/>CCRYP_007424-RA protein AED:0.35 eAED:0.35 QI:0/-1/0/1/-1/1/1/0/521